MQGYLNKTKCLLSLCKIYHYYSLHLPRNRILFQKKLNSDNGSCFVLTARIAEDFMLEARQLVD